MGFLDKVLNFAKPTLDNIFNLPDKLSGVLGVANSTPATAFKTEPKKETTIGKLTYDPDAFGRVNDATGKILNPMFGKLGVTRNNLLEAKPRTELAMAGMLADMALGNEGRIAGELAGGIRMASKLPGSGVVGGLAKLGKESSIVNKADDLTTSIQKAKQSGQSFDEWVKKEAFNPNSKFEYHLSDNPNLVSGKTFSEQIKPSNIGERGFAGKEENIGQIFTTKNPQQWSAQLNFEGNKKSQYVYLVEVKNPAKVDIMDGLPHQSINPPQDVKILKRVGGQEAIENPSIMESAKQSQLQAEWDAVNSSISKDTIKSLQYGKEEAIYATLNNPKMIDRAILNLSQEGVSAGKGTLQTGDRLKELVEINKKRPLTKAEIDEANYWLGEGGINPFDYAE